jgi:hypoxanthine phosphoribosyltransferase
VVGWVCGYNYFHSKHCFPPEYDGHFDSLMIAAADIRARVRELAHLLHADYAGGQHQRPIMICTLKGACPFYMHLLEALQELRQGYDMEFVRASSYDGTASTGIVTLLLGDLPVARLTGRHVIMVEDIVDTGTTLATIVPLLKEKGQPASIHVCTLLDKRLDDADEKKFVASYCGFSIPNRFIIGYGYDERLAAPKCI